MLADRYVDSSGEIRVLPPCFTRNWPCGAVGRATESGGNDDKSDFVERSTGRSFGRNRALLDLVTGGFGAYFSGRRPGETASKAYPGCQLTGRESTGRGG